MACQTMLTITLISFRRESKQVVPPAPERAKGKCSRVDPSLLPMTSNADVRVHKLPCTPFLFH